MANIRFIYGKANRNAGRDKHLYQETFSNRKFQIDRNLLKFICLVENGAFSHQQRSGYPITIRALELEELLEDFFTVSNGSQTENGFNYGGAPTHFSGVTTNWLNENVFNF